MQIIILLLLSSVAFAQKNIPGNQCDPVEAEKQCYNLLCSNSSKKIIPSDADELTAAYQAHPYELHPDMVEGMARMDSISNSIKNTARKKLADGGLDKMTDELFANPVETSFLIKDLYAGELHCLHQKRKCVVISSDLKPQSEEMKNFFQKINDSTYLFREQNNLDVKDKKELLNEMLVGLTGRLSSEEIKAERKKISKLKNYANYMIYTMDAPWLTEYKKKVAEELKPYKAAVEASLKVKIEGLLAIDLSSDEAKLKIKRSCQLADFVKTTLDRNTHSFDEKVIKIIDSFKTKFLPRLSESSAKELSQRINPKNIFLIKDSAKYHPAYPNIGHHNGYKEPQNNAQALRDLTYLSGGLEYKCDVKGLLVKDHFNFGNDSIHISSYAVANNLNDAISHELGHWLSAQMKHKNMSGHSRRKLLEIRECVSNFYPSDKEKSTFALNHSGDKSRTEEDFADWFTAKAGMGESGLFCDLKKMMNNFVGTSKESSYLPQKGDPHSNFLFREINLRLNRDEKLPQSCKDLIDYYHPDPKPQKCDW